MHVSRKKFKHGYYLCQYVDTLAAENSVVFRLEEIVLSANFDSPCLLCERMKVLNYLQHLAALEIDISRSNGNVDEEYDSNLFTIFSIDRLQGPPLNVNRMVRSRHMLRPKLYY